MMATATLMTPTQLHITPKDESHNAPSFKVAPALIGKQAQAPIVLTAQPLLRSRQDVAAALRAADFDIRHVATWDRLPEGAERITADVALIDLDAVDQACQDGGKLSGHRLVTLLTRLLKTRSTAIVILTSLDYAEIEDLARAGIHALAVHTIPAKTLVKHVHVAIEQARKRHADAHRHSAVAVAPHTEPPAPTPSNVLQLTSISTPPAAQSKQRPTRPTTQHDDGWRMPDAIWNELAPLLPNNASHAHHKWTDRQVMDALLFSVRTGAPLTALPRSLGAAATVQRRLRAWRAAGVFERLYAAATTERLHLPGASAQTNARIERLALARAARVARRSSHT